MLNRKKPHRIIFSLLLILVWFAIHGTAFSQSVINTVHNLAVSGPGTVKASIETDVCIFCHTPHRSKPSSPLWNRDNPGVIYTLYNSSTLHATPGQPDGSSILCLSCHDGTIALGNVSSRPAAISFTGGITTMPPGKKNLGTDLSDDHPVSFLYDAALALSDGQLKTPSSITVPVKLDHFGKMQCTSCHDPHLNLTNNFLVTTNQSSNICNSCHQRSYWDNSTHQSSSANWNGLPPNPWAHLSSPYNTVGQNACSNCHSMHSAGGKSHLMKHLNEENNCLDCHNGNGSSTNILAQFAKLYKHNVGIYSGIHDPTENSLASVKHVECTDCHNPHASNASAATAPNVKGYNLGVKGVNQSGIAVFPALYEYQICYRCHSDNSWAPASATPRVINENNARIEFATTNPSFHPVVGARNNLEITNNLLFPNTASTVLYCSSCHASDGTGAPKGPHGSIYPNILKLQYLTSDGASSANGVTESPSAYALCYSCHNRDNIIDSNNSNTFKEHKKHIVNERTPCNTCHDPHGIAGTSTNNSNLINFRTGVVTPYLGIIRFVDTGVRTGNCTLVCHGRIHNAESY
jgi:predicted CXXCH cytochrome family protein